MAQVKRSYKVEHLSPSDLTAYRIKAMSLIDKVLSSTQALIHGLNTHSDDAFYIPNRTKMSALSGHETVARALMDIYYDDEQGVTESKQYPAAVRCRGAIKNLINECNIARSQYGSFWSVVSSIRVPSQPSKYDFLSTLILKDTRYARVNYHQAERLIHFVDGPQPTSIGFVMYGSPNPNRVTKQFAWNLAVKMLPESKLRQAESVLRDIPEDETLCYLKDNTPRARLNIRQKIDGTAKSRQVPAVLPVFYNDQGMETKITDSMDSNHRRAPRPPSRRESEPLIEGLALYRYLLPFRHAKQ